MSLEPLTDYSKFKANCEEILFKYKSDNFITSVIRPATVCGYSPRQRLDLVVNILTNQHIIKKKYLYSVVLSLGQIYILRTWLELTSYS